MVNGSNKLMARPIRDDEREFLWEILEKGEKKGEYKDSKEYVRFYYKGKNYKRSRILYQIYHNVILYDDEIIHHKDRNKQNDKITNLELKNSSEHMSEHHADKRKKYKERIKSNKLSEEIINKIFKLKQEQIQKGIKVNYSKIADKLNISSQTVRGYILGLR